jgi:hypothetical protein
MTHEHQTLESRRSAARRAGWPYAVAATHKNSGTSRGMLMAALVGIAIWGAIFWVLL